MTLKRLKPRIKTANTERAAPVTKRITGRKLKAIRERILERDGYACRKCGRVSWDLEIDHIVPLHLGGAESDDNRAAMCGRCHRLKTEAEQKRRDG